MTAELITCANAHKRLKSPNLSAAAVVGGVPFALLESYDSAGGRQGVVAAANCKPVLTRSVGFRSVGPSAGAAAPCKKACASRRHRTPPPTLALPRFPRSSGRSLFAWISCLHRRPWLWPAAAGVRARQRRRLCAVRWNAPVGLKSSSLPETVVGPAPWPSWTTAPVRVVVESLSFPACFWEACSVGDFWGEPERAAPVRRVLETATGLGGLRMGRHFLILVSSCSNNSFGSIRF